MPPCAASLTNLVSPAPSLEVAANAGAIARRPARAAMANRLLSLLIRLALLSSDEWENAMRRSEALDSWRLQGTRSKGSATEEAPLRYRPWRPGTPIAHM